MPDGLSWNAVYCMRDVLRELAEKHRNRITYVEHPRNRGKGAAVRDAWNEAPGAEWLAFVDADGSLAPAGLLALIQTALDAECSVLAIRRRTASTEVVETPVRAVAHRAFLTAGGVFSDDLIDAYIDLKMENVTRLRMTTHPVEFDMYYSL